MHVSHSGEQTNKSHKQGRYQTKQHQTLEEAPVALNGTQNAPVYSRRLRGGGGGGGSCIMLHTQSFKCFYRLLFTIKSISAIGIESVNQK